MGSNDSLSAMANGVPEQVIMNRFTHSWVSRMQEIFEVEWQKKKKNLLESKKGKAASVPESQFSRIYQNKIMEDHFEGLASSYNKTEALKRAYSPPRSDHYSPNFDEYEEIVPKSKRANTTTDESESGNSSMISSTITEEPDFNEIVNTVSVLSTLNEISNKLGHLGAAIPLLVEKAVKSEARKENPILCIDDDDMYLLQMVLVRLTAYDSKGNLIEKIIVSEAKNQLSTLINHQKETRIVDEVVKSNQEMKTNQTIKYLEERILEEHLNVTASELFTKITKVKLRSLSNLGGEIGDTFIIPNSEDKINGGNSQQPTRTHSHNNRDNKLKCDFGEAWRVSETPESFKNMRNDLKNMLKSVTGSDPGPSVASASTDFNRPPPNYFLDNTVSTSRSSISASAKAPVTVPAFAPVPAPVTEEDLYYYTENPRRRSRNNKSANHGNLTGVTQTSLLPNKSTRPVKTSNLDLALGQKVIDQYKSNTSKHSDLLDVLQTVLNPSTDPSSVDKPSQFVMDPCGEFSNSRPATSASVPVPSPSPTDTATRINRLKFKIDKRHNKFTMENLMPELDDAHHE